MKNKLTKGTGKGIVIELTFKGEAGGKTEMLSDQKCFVYKIVLRMINLSELDFIFLSIV